MNQYNNTKKRGDMQKLWEIVFNEDSGIGTALTSILYHKTYKETYSFLQKSQWWSTKQLQDYQWQQLKTLCNHAYEHIPYYQKLFDSLSMKPDDIHSLQDFQNIPFLTKELVQEHLNELKATNYPSTAFEDTVTGGSTGFPLKFYVEKGVWYANHLAYIQTLLDRAHCRPFDKSVLMTGSKKPWEYRPFSKTLVLSSFYMTDEKLPVYVKKIRRLRPRYIMGYPSAITMLTTYMKKNNIVLRGLNAVFCYGETLYDWQREFLEDFFQCRVHGQYGHREQSVLAGTCEKSNAYHVFPEYGFVELIDQEGKPVTNEGTRGEIVATGFHTSIFPFIRYRTGDVGVFTAAQCSCGRNYPLLKSVEGRVQDFVLSKTHRLVPFMGVHHLVASSSEQVKECQLYQEKEGELILSIVKKGLFSEHDASQILEGFRKRFDDEFIVTLRYVDAIPRTSRGKYQFLIQKLPIHFSP
jgi:phenylacetate-CoA ligase